MKRNFKPTSILISSLLFFSPSFSQSDPIISGARKYLKERLKDPESYREFSIKKNSWRISDSLESVLFDNESKIANIKTYDSSALLEYSKTLEDLGKLSENNREKFREERKSKRSSIEKEIKLIEPYSDSLKFIGEYNKWREKLIDELTKDTSIEEKYSNANRLREAGEKGDVRFISFYSKNLENSKNKLKNIDSTIRESYEYRRNIFIKYKSLKEEYSNLTKIIESSNSEIDSISLFSVYYRQSNTLDEIKNYRELYRSMSSFLESKPSKLDSIYKNSKLIQKRIKELKANPTLDKPIYYYVTIDYSATNSYGGRIRGTETINYKKGYYWID
jgi:hypothetical protein